ncbi:hypothetical protein D1164_20295 [Mariniphaga sediminis]|jgi:hypothetical protein|uniref:DUF3575 domain-containing protein n=1 Tax=Mariniphaga sediminis TaxID=1628158 RepID=A0A399CUG1_9BACT|nr:hypothetical protein [Mariniphaga sediminis]RIH63329.1 hypothetical protein D1164_20295 [Mariniphaga sediminis]
MKNLVLIATFFMLATTLFGQTEKPDSIFTKNGKVLTGKVKEIGTSEVKYIQPQMNTDVVYAIDKNEVDRIVFANGQVQKFDTEWGTIEENSAELFQIQKKNALKIDFLSIAANTLTVTYERCLKPGRSVEFSGGIIGIGVALEEENASGVLFRGGYKFAKNPDFYLREMRYSHILKGAYVKLEFDFASYAVTGQQAFFDEEKRYNNTKWALLMVPGKQWVFDDSFLIDIYCGIGLGDNSLEDLDLTYPYGFATLGENFPLAFSFGVRMGLLLK